MVEMKDVVDKLAQLTGQGQVPWRTTVDKSAFAATFGNLSVIIRADNPGLEDELSSYRLSVLDERGNEIDSTSAVVVGEPGATRPALAFLYISAKRTALGSEKRLEELMEAMNQVSRA